MPMLKTKYVSYHWVWIGFKNHFTVHNTNHSNWIVTWLNKVCSFHALSSNNKSLLAFNSKKNCLLHHPLSLHFRSGLGTVSLTTLVRLMHRWLRCVVIQTGAPCWAGSAAFTSKDKDDTLSCLLSVIIVPWKWTVGGALVLFRHCKFDQIVTLQDGNSGGIQFRPGAHCWAGSAAFASKIAHIPVSYRSSRLRGVVSATFNLC